MIRSSTRSGSPTRVARPLQHQDFVLQADAAGGRDYIELNQLLKLAGLCDSGGAGKHLVASGAVRVDGQPELRKTCKLRAGQVVVVGEHLIRICAAE